MEHVVETFSLTKKFSDWWGREKVVAVDELNLQIRPNEVFGLLGPNGSGKTTTIKMLLGLLHPTKGKALIFGGDSTDSDICKRIGFLPEESYLYKYLSARETLDFYGRLFGLPSKVRKMRIESLLDMVGLKAMANRPVGTFSKGMARRIGLAQALINDPDLLILDEPTTGLDPIGTRQIKDLIIKLAKRGKTILLCSHLLADVEDVCDRISILYGGRVQAEGRVDELLRLSDKCQITTDRLSSIALDKIKEIILGEEASIEISSPMEKLETFFVHTVTVAQNKDAPTSGAMSTTEIGEFLLGESQQQLLDSLVSANSNDVTQNNTKPETVKPDSDAIETKTPQADTDFLSKLSNTAETLDSTPVQIQPAAPESESADKVRKDILDQLTSRPTDSDQDVNKEEGSDV